MVLNPTIVGAAARSAARNSSANDAADAPWSISCSASCSRRRISELGAPERSVITVGEEMAPVLNPVSMIHRSMPAARNRVRSNSSPGSAVRRAQ